MASNETKARQNVSALMSSPTALTTKRGLRRPLTVTALAGCGQSESVSTSSRSTSRRSPSIFSTPEDEKIFRDISVALTVTTPSAAKNKLKKFSGPRKLPLSPTTANNKKCFSPKEETEEVEIETSNERFFSRGGALAISKPERVSATTYNHCLSSDPSSDADDEAESFSTNTTSYYCSSESIHSSDMSSQYESTDVWSDFSTFSSSASLDDNESSSSDSESDSSTVVSDSVVLSHDESIIVRRDDASIFSDAFATLDQDESKDVRRDDFSAVSDAFATLILSKGSGSSVSDAFLSKVSSTAISSLISDAYTIGVTSMDEFSAVSDAFVISVTSKESTVFTPTGEQDEEREMIAGLDIDRNKNKERELGDNHTSDNQQVGLPNFQFDKDNIKTATEDEQERTNASQSATVTPINTNVQSSETFKSVKQIKDLSTSDSVASKQYEGSYEREQQEATNVNTSSSEGLTSLEKHTCHAESSKTSNLLNQVESSCMDESDSQTRTPFLMEAGSDITDITTLSMAQKNAEPILMMNYSNQFSVGTTSTTSTATINNIETGDADAIFMGYARFLINFFESRLDNGSNEIILLPEAKAALEERFNIQANLRFIDLLRKRCAASSAATNETVIRCCELGLDREGAQNPLFATLALEKQQVRFRFQP